jgi:uncharacterized protein
MGVTSKLLRLYRVDQQLNGLKRRLRAAERYLAQQDRELSSLDERCTALETQKRQLESAIHNDETEAKALEQRIETSRDRMNNAQTSKEHSALLTEVNTLKADKGRIEERVLENMQALETIREELETVAKDRAEREKVKTIATTDRDERQSEIAERVAELEEQRKEALADVPASALGVYEQLLEQFDDDDEVMAPVEEQDRRNREYTCGACYTHLPVEQVNVLLNRGDLQRCPSCSVILFMETDLRDEIVSAAEKKRGKKAVGAK